MALSNNARRLLAQAAGGAIGGVAAGKQGFVGGVGGGSAAIETAISDEQKQAAQTELEKRRDIATQLQLLDTKGLDVESRQEIARDIAMKTGLNPDELKITLDRNFKAADLLSVIGDKDVPAEARKEAWKAFSTEFGLKSDIDFEGVSSAFQDLTPEEKQDIFEQLSDPNQPIKDINRVAHFFANFGGEGESITSAQLQAINLTEGPLGYEDRIGLAFTKHDLNAKLTVSDFFKFGVEMAKASAIMGRATLSPREVEANARMWATGLQTLVDQFRVQFPDATFPGRDGEGSNDSAPTSGKMAARNLNRIRSAIMDGKITDADKATEVLLNEGRQVVTSKDLKLIESWIEKAAQADSGGDQ